ncbi:MAG: translation initiation factor IF-3 [Candidatus Kapaibacteriales bacterium]
MFFIKHGPIRGRFVKPEPQRKTRINREIKVKEVRVINPDGDMIGVMKIDDAVHRAEQYEMDLVEISPNAKPPVCKIIDYGKYAYELQKREKLQRKNQKQQEMKELRFKPRTDTHDFNFKAKHGREFLEEGNKLKATVMFRGREITHKEFGYQMLEKLVEELKDVSKIDSPIRSEGRNLSVILAPDKKSPTKEREEEED